MAFFDEQMRKHAEFLATPLDKNEWIDLLMRYQAREASCLFVLEKIEHDRNQLWTALRDLNERVHSGYNFNTDPDGMTLRVSRALKF